MSTPRSAVLGVTLLAAAACVPRTTATSANPTVLKPHRGPDASLYVNYSGGMLNRRVSSTFRVDESAYVLVGHLGGDGVIRVLYPDSPDQSGFVEAGSTVRTPPVEAYYDATPSLFSYAGSPYRHSGALYDSYDGRGNAFLFIIASSQPLDFDELDVDGEWDELVVNNFINTSDPRWAIREYADLLSDGGAYTLRFAGAAQSQHLTSYARSYADCSMMWGLGYSPLAFSYFFSPMSSWYSPYGYLAPLAYGGPSHCGSNYWYAYDRSFARRPIIIAYRPPTPVTRPLFKPVKEVPQVVTREGRRPTGDGTVLTLDRTAFGPEDAPRATLGDAPERPQGPRHYGPAVDAEDDIAVPVRTRRAQPVERRDTPQPRPTRVREKGHPAPASARPAPSRPSTERTSRPAPSRPTRTERPRSDHRKPRPDGQR